MTTPTASASPVTPVRTEPRGPLTVEVHTLWAADDVPLSATRVPPQGDRAHATPVVLVHGSYSTRRFWISPKGIGLGPYLAARGYDVWIPELRGHGRSPRTERFNEFTAEDHMRLDLPAFQRYVRRLTGRREFLVGHSAGGLFCYGSLAAGWLEADLLGLVVLGAQVDRGDLLLKVPPVVWLLRAVTTTLGHFPSARLGYGPEVEPPGEMLEYARWKGLGGRWTTSDGRSYHAGMGRVTAPLLAFAAARDRGDPPRGCLELFERAASVDRRFVLLGRAAGYSMDYGHVEMIVSPAARDEVWPQIARFMDDRHAPV